MENIKTTSETQTLDTLGVGEKCVVNEVVCSDRQLRNRLISMGIVKGRELFVKRIAPLGDPIKIELLGFKLSLRLAEAENIRVSVTE